MIEKSKKQMGISFDPQIMEQLFALASTHKYGSVKTIITAAVNQYLDNLNSDIKEKQNDNSSK